MPSKETQTLLSSHSNQSERESTSLQTVFDDGDTYDVADGLESNGGSSKIKPERSPNEKDNLIVDWNGTNDPACCPIPLRVYKVPLIQF